MDLIDSLIKQGYLKTERIIKAFREVKRADFMLDDVKVLAEIDEAMPIGHEQTISQPLTVAFMLEHLEPKLGDNVLDIGSGSGWTTALLSNIVGENGRVTAIEIIPALKEFGEKNAYHYVEKGIAQFICGDGSRGYKEEAPYDKILVSATHTEVIEAWKDQLKIGGKLVCPIKESILVVTKKSKEDFEEKEYPGFLFVPLT
jgi:protein-L-isoaspartate(D-aspartate) O-methyltransferase